MQERPPIWASTLPVFMFVFFAVLFIFWVSQFVHLMKRGDADFPGRYDKLIWAVLLILTNVLGAFTYWLCRPHPVPTSNDDLRRQFEMFQKNQP